MSAREDQVKWRTREIKRGLAGFQEFYCVNDDLVYTDSFNSFSNDLYIYRNEEDRFVYLVDNEDGSEHRVTLENLKKIIENIARREINDKYELEELEKYFNTID
ncbi:MULTISPECIES: hypothetical protein [Paenibacillus]|uniref:hypothetical protein n=1 Tax=Paenibacillus TaxID=44249 RepID=UPI0003FBA8CB|nr:hypothetical protein [Paenibacillus massiliensis]